MRNAHLPKKKFYELIQVIFLTYQPLKDQNLKIDLWKNILREIIN